MFLIRKILMINKEHIVGSNTIMNISVISLMSREGIPRNVLTANRNNHKVNFLRENKFQRILFRRVKSMTTTQNQSAGLINFSWHTTVSVININHKIGELVVRRRRKKKQK